MKTTILFPLIVFACICLSSCRTSRPYAYNYQPKAIAAVCVNDKWGFINTKGKEIIKPQYDSTGLWQSGLIPVRSGNKWGFINKKGKQLTSFKYDSVTWSNDRLYFVMLDDKWGAVNKKGKEIIPLATEDISYCNYPGTLLRGRSGDSYILYNTKGKEVADTNRFAIVEAYFGDCSYIPVQSKDSSKYAVINKNGKLFTPFKYDYISYFYHGMAIAKKDDKYILLDKRMNEIPVEKNYNDLYSFETNFAVAVSYAEMSTIYGLINKAGKEVVAPQYKNIENYSWHSFIKVQTPNGSWGVLNNKAKVVVEPAYDNIDFQDKEMIKVEKKDKYGLINKEGKIVIPLEYESIEDFHDGLAVVQKAGKYGYINRQGQEIIPLIYKEANYFSEGYAIVWSGDQYKIINKKGKEIKSLDISGFSFNGYSIITVNKDDKWSFMNMKGELLFPYKYDSTHQYFNLGFTEVKQNGKWGFVSKKGKEIVPPKYDRVQSFMWKKELYISSISIVEPSPIPLIDDIVVIPPVEEVVE